MGSVAYFFVRRAAWIWPEHALVLSTILYAVSVVLYYRAALFIHELTHLRDRTFGAFRIVWNLLCGIPFLMPSFMYYSHVEHHMRKHFGTHDDGEYLPLGTTGPWNRIVFDPATAYPDPGGTAVSRAGSARLADSFLSALAAPTRIVPGDGPQLRATASQP
jgi:fatty acid desaturase